MKRRYVVLPCDDAGTLAGATRERTWTVHDTQFNRCVADLVTRDEARATARTLERDKCIGCVGTYHLDDCPQHAMCL